MTTTKGYKSAGKLFGKVSHLTADPNKSNAMFDKLANVLNKLGKAENIRDGTDLCLPLTGEVPCDLTEINLSMSPCGMVQKIGTLLNHVSANCQRKFKRNHRETYDKLRDASGCTHLARSSFSMLQGDFDFDGVRLKSGSESPASSRLPKLCSLQESLSGAVDYAEEAKVKFLNLMLSEDNSPAFVSRLKKRYHAFIKFIVDESFNCEWALTDCDLIRAVFSDELTDDNTESMLEKALLLTNAIEESCPSISFAKYFITVGGRLYR